MVPDRIRLWRSDLYIQLLDTFGLQFDTCSFTMAYRWYRLRPASNASNMGEWLAERYTNMDHCTRTDLCNGLLAGNER